mmetsp:Transcript_121514/g.303207  ORF Transcript_121514/g.303207 Transcript_121514/m.303207 type:complete len:268 (+) Transcript_121514:1515-2318(+)
MWLQRPRRRSCSWTGDPACCRCWSTSGRSAPGTDSGWPQWRRSQLSTLRKRIFVASATGCWSQMLRLAQRVSVSLVSAVCSWRTCPRHPAPWCRRSAERSACTATRDCQLRTKRYPPTSMSLASRLGCDLHLGLGHSARRRGTWIQTRLLQKLATCFACCGESASQSLRTSRTVWMPSARRKLPLIMRRSKIRVHSCRRPGPPVTICLWLRSLNPTGLRRSARRAMSGPLPRMTSRSPTSWQKSRRLLRHHLASSSWSRSGYGKRRS